MPASLSRRLPFRPMQRRQAITWFSQLLGTPTRGGNDVIDGELRGRHPFATVLAGAIVAKEEVAPVRPQQAPGGLDGGQEPDDDNVLTKATTRHCLLDRLPGNIR